MTLKKFNLVKYQEIINLQENINFLQYKILIYLSHWMGKNNYVWPSNKMVLDAVAKESIDSIKKRLKELEEKKYIEREMDGKQRRIYLLDPLTGKRFAPKGTPQVPHEIGGGLPKSPWGDSPSPPLPNLEKEERKNDVVVVFSDKILTALPTGINTSDAMLISAISECSPTMLIA